MNPNSLIGKKAPSFTLDGISLKDFIGKKVVLYFYPRDNTPGCTLEAMDFTSKLKDFQKLNCEVIGISKDNKKSHENFKKKHKLKITLLSDEDHNVQEKFGVWQKKKFMGREFMGTVRTTFIINEKGKVKHVFENVKVKDHVKLVLEKLKEI